MAEIIAFDSRVAEKLTGKVDKVSGKGLSTNDFTDLLKAKLEGFEPSDFVTKAYISEKLPYSFTSFGVTDGGTIKLESRFVSVVVPSSGGISFNVGGFDQGLDSDGIVRDCVLVVDCRGITEAPTITWSGEFHPRTYAETDFACYVGLLNVYWVSEYAPNHFAVAGWQETEGGNAA